MRTPSCVLRVCRATARHRGERGGVCPVSGNGRVARALASPDKARLVRQQDHRARCAPPT